MKMSFEVPINEKMTQQFRNIEVVRYPVTINIKKLDSRAIIPTHGSEEAAGWDLYADLPDGQNEVEINPHETCKISTGIAMAIPTGYCVPSMYWSVAGHTGQKPNDRARVVEHGERIAQLVLHEVIPIALNEVPELDETERGTGGFGSTGTK